MPPPRGVPILAKQAAMPTSAFPGPLDTAAKVDIQIAGDKPDCGGYAEGRIAPPSFGARTRDLRPESEHSAGGGRKLLQDRRTRGSGRLPATVPPVLGTCGWNSPASGAVGRGRPPASMDARRLGTPRPAEPGPAGHLRPRSPHWRCTPRPQASVYFPASSTQSLAISSTTFTASSITWSETHSRTL